MYRKTYVEVDMDIINDNIKKIIKTYNKYKYYIGVVKNNAYAHGIEVIKAMIDAKVNYLAVSSLEEALSVRNMYKDIPILILEPIDIEYISICKDNNITITIDNIEYYKELTKKKINLKYHLKIDTGMNRFGIKDKDEVNYIVNNKSKYLYLEGIYTHLMNGMPTSNIYNNQIKTFKYLTSDIDLNKIDIVHIDRSLTLEQHDKLDFCNGVRLGILMYGITKPNYTPSWKRKIYNILTNSKPIEDKSKLNLKSAFIFKTHVMRIKQLHSGEMVGYGSNYICDKDTKIALLPYGFADFIYNNKSQVYINNKAYDIISINMDVTTIIVDESVSVNDPVEIFGNNISLREKSRQLNINVYKLVTGVTNRVPRIYKYNKKK